MPAMVPISRAVTNHLRGEPPSKSRAVSMKMIVNELLTDRLMVSVRDLLAKSTKLDRGYCLSDSLMRSKTTTVS